MSGTLICGKDPVGNTIIPIAVNANGELEMTAEIDSAGLAQEETLVAQSAKLPVSLGPKANSGSLSTTRSTTAGAYDMSGRTDIANSATSTKLLCDALGKLQVDVVGGVGGDATAANQALQIIQETATALSVDSIDTKTPSKNGNSQVLLTSAGGTAVKADTTCVVEADVEGRVGWQLTNPVAATKFNLYYFNGAQETITLGDVQSIYAVGAVNVNSETSSVPFFHIYTKPTGVGDQQPWYHSKIDYNYDNDNTIGIGEECVFYGEGEPSTKFSQRKIQFNDKVVNGDGLPAEEVLYMVCASNSGATVDSKNITLNTLGFNTGLLARNLHLETAEEHAGLATEATLSTMSSKLPASLGQKANSGSLSTTRSNTVGTYDMSGRTTIGTAGTSTKLLCDALGKLQVDVVGGAATSDATAANQALQLAQAVANATSVNNIDNKITQGADTTLAAAQQVLCYGEVTSGPGIGELHPIHITSAGDVEVEIADFVKGQDIMAASFPVVIASDQSSLTVDGTVAVSGGTIAVTSTSLASETTLSSLNGKVTACDTGSIAGTVAVSGGTIAVTSASLASETTLSALNTKVTACDTGSIAGTVAVSGGTIAVTSGSLASETTLSALNTKVTACDTGSIAGTVAISGGTIAVSAIPSITGTVAVSGGTIAVTSASLASETTLSALNTKVTACDTGSIAGTVAVSGVSGTVAVSATALPLPSGASTETTLNAINNKITFGDANTLGSMQCVGIYAERNNGAWAQLQTDMSNNLRTTDANITNGTQITKCMGNFSGSQVQLKVDANGVLETSGGGGGSYTQYDSASTLPTPTVGTAVIGVDSGGLANVISTDDTGKVGSVIHGTNSLGVAYPVRINQYSGAITVDDYVNKTSYLSTQTATIPAGTSNYLYPTPTSLATARSISIFGNTTNWTDPIYLYAAKNGYSGIKYKMWQNPIQPDPSSGDFYINLPLHANPYLYWSKANTTLVAETISVEIVYMD